MSNEVGSPKSLDVVWFKKTFLLVTKITAI